MFHRILIPLAFNDENEAAIRVGSDLATREGSEVLLLHVVETIRGIPFEEMRDFYERLERRAESELGKVADRFRALQVSVKSDVVFGARAEQIVTYAKERGADLIVLSSHPASPDQPASLGTISHRVALFASCPVLLVK
ncbi:MAG: universal stress protein [Acidobacteriota bacterium]